jgi:hypothetical protein
MKDTSLYKVPVTIPPLQAVVHTRPKRPLSMAHPPDLPRRARHYIEGMKPMNNRLLTRFYYDAYKHLSDTYTNRRRCGIEGGLLRLWVYPAATVSQQGNLRTPPLVSILRPL